MDTPLVDVVLGGRYRLHSLLGSGGMAQVYDGWDERLARPVAVKLLRPDLAANPELGRRFELEARAAARLTHPNVVAVYDAGDDRGRSYIVMERLPGESLADRIGHGPVDLTWLRRLATEVLAALGAAHEAGIIHRDIKPANILLGSDGRAKVADFGIARVVESPLASGTAGTDTALTAVGLVLGTPAYLAPERAMGQPATAQSDLYSLGVVLYEALTGVKPFAGATPVAIAAAAIQGAAQNPALLRPDADPQLVAVIGRAMALDPSQRYPSAADMADDLRRPASPATAVMSAAELPVGLSLAGGPAPLAARTRGAPTMLAGASMGRRVRRAPPLRTGRQWGLVGLGGAAVIVVVVLILAANPGPGARASSTAGGVPRVTTSTTIPATAASPASTTATTKATVATASRVDTAAAALRGIASTLGGSSSAAAPQLAAALNSVAASTDPAARAAAASSTLNQAVQWFQQGKLSTVDYVAAAAVLHLAGAPAAPPPTAPTVTKGNGKAAVTEATDPESADDAADTGRAGTARATEPVAALERIAYLLERAREPTYRVRAFRTAAATVAKVGAERLAELAASGRLRDLPGIGETTAKVIVEALAGHQPHYLERLEGEAEPEVPRVIDPAVAALRAALRGDCHTHSDWSDGGSPIDTMARAARDLGHAYMVLTDHSPRLTIAHGLSPDRLRQQLEVVAALNEEMAPFRVLTGIEVDILEDGSLDQEDELLASLDVVVASVHSKLRMDRRGMTSRMVKAMEHPHADILGHCTGRLLVGRGRPESDFRCRRRLRHLRPIRQGGGDQLEAGTVGSPQTAAQEGPRPRLRGVDRHRRPRPGPARVADQRLRARRRVRRAGRPGDQRLGR